MDVVGDLITRLRNGCMRKRLSVKVNRSKYIEKILDCLYEEGYIRGYKREEREIEVLLKYKDGWSVIKEVKRISKPSKRVYYGKEELRKARERREVLVYTGTVGVWMNMREVVCGGEVLFSIK